MNPYEALREGAAWIDLSARGRIYAVGEDRARLLHAMTTNHIQQLKPGEGCYAFFLTAQGKILADVDVLCLEERFLLDVEPEVRTTVYQHLDKFIIADDVTLEDASETLGAAGLEGPGAAAVLEAMGAPAPAKDWGTAQWGERLVARISIAGGQGFRIYAPDMPALVSALESAGAVQAGAETVRTVRIENFHPRYGEDIYETTLPMETQQMHGVHFQKGCYLGQEVVERVRSRGHVNRLLVGFEAETEFPPEPKSVLTAPDGAEVGKVTSAIFSPAMARTAGMAYVRVSHASPGTALTAGGTRVTVRELRSTPIAKVG